MAERKTAEIKLRIEPSRKAQWQQAAADEEIGLSEFIVQACEERRWSKLNQSLDGTKLISNAIDSLREIGAGDSAAVAKLEYISTSSDSAAPSNFSVAPDSAPTKDRDSDWQEPKPFNDDYKPWRFSK